MDTYGAQGFNLLKWTVAPNGQQVNICNGDAETRFQFPGERTFPLKFMYVGFKQGATNEGQRKALAFQNRSQGRERRGVGPAFGQVVIALEMLKIKLDLKVEMEHNVPDPWKLSLYRQGTDVVYFQWRRFQSCTIDEALLQCSAGRGSQKE